MLCRECGGELVFKNYVLFCSRCGTVYEEAPVVAEETDHHSITRENSPLRLGTRTRRYYSYDEKRFARVLYYIRVYTRDLPRDVRRRAVFIARKNIEKVDKWQPLEPFALACVEKAARERNLTVFSRVKNRATVRRARRYMREILGPAVRDIGTVVRRVLLQLCTCVKVDYEECVKMYERYSSVLCSHTPKMAAAAVVYVVKGLREGKSVEELKSISLNTLKLQTIVKKRKRNRKSIRKRKSTTNSQKSLLVSEKNLLKIARTAGVSSSALATTVRKLLLKMYGQS